MHIAGRNSRRTMPKPSRGRQKNDADLAPWQRNDEFYLEELKH